MDLATLTDPDDSLRWQLVGVVNHELRTPLTTLVGHLELLQELELPEPARRSVAAIARAGEQLTDLASTVSELVELDAVTASLARVRTDLVALACEVAGAYAVRATHAGVTLRVLEPTTEAIAMVDRQKVRRALVALVTNALEHAPAGTPVDLEVAAGLECVAVSVVDRGPGIAEEHLQRVCAPFAGPERSPEQMHGRGLGLALCNAVAAAHGGQLLLGQNAPTGLRASLRLPLERLHLAC